MSQTPQIMKSHDVARMTGASYLYPAIVHILSVQVIALFISTQVFTTVRFPK